jgi:hypothetical protein
MLAINISNYQRDRFQQIWRSLCKSQQEAWCGKWAVESICCSLQTYITLASGSYGLEIESSSLTASNW